MSRRGLHGRILLFSLALAPVAWASPADEIKAPRPEPCVPFVPDPAEDGISAPRGLDLDEVRTALNGVIQYALKCGQPEGVKEAHLTFELVVRCDGTVASVVASDDGKMPAEYVACVAAVIGKADFPGHDMEDGMPATYPVNVTW